MSINMEIKILNLPFDVNTSNILISKVYEDNRPIVNEFIINHCAEYRDYLDDTLFICYQISEGYKQILGIFSFKENAIPIDGVRDDINFNELNYLIIDWCVLNYECLLRVFSIILPMLVDRNDSNNECIWFNYRGSLYSRKIDKVFKTCREYYFQNESEYFASTIVDIQQQIDENEYWFNLLLNH